MQAVLTSSATTTTTRSSLGTPAQPAARRASSRVIAAVALGLVVLSAVFTGTGTYPAPADQRPGSGAGQVVTP